MLNAIYENDLFFDGLIDTRDLDTNYKRIPGSGDAHECDFCKKSHEVWAFLRNMKTKEAYIVGSSCAKKNSRMHIGDKQYLKNDYTVTKQNGGRYTEEIERIKRQYLEWKQ